MAERISFQDQIRNNKIKSFLLIIVIFIVFVFIGWIIALAVDPGYFFFVMIISVIFSLSYILISYYNSDKIALASVNARPATRERDRKFYDAAENMSLASGLPVPRLYVMDSSQINAFATGRNPENAVICVTSGAMEKLDKQELEGVIAHEMSHIANYDMRFMTIVAVMIGLISIIAQIFLRSLWFSSGDGDRKGNIGIFIIAVVAAILAPLVAQLVSLAISRKREFGADATAVKFTRYPVGLRKALIKIKGEHPDERDKKKYPQAAAPLFISDPFKKKVQGLLSTHPDINERIKRLERM